MSALFGPLDDDRITYNPVSETWQVRLSNGRTASCGSRRAAEACLDPGPEVARALDAMSNWVGSWEAIES